MDEPRTQVTKHSKDIGDTYSKDMGDTFLLEEVPPMPWEGVTVEEQRQNFIRDFLDRRCTVVDLAQAFGISRKTACPVLRTAVDYLD